jgi:hypothetical protein
VDSFKILHHRELSEVKIREVMLSQTRNLACGEKKRRQNFDREISWKVACL